MQNYSVTQGGNLMVVAAAASLIIKQMWNVEVVPDNIVTVLTAIGVCISWFGRFRQGDVHFSGFKKS